MSVFRVITPKLSQTNEHDILTSASAEDASPLFVAMRARLPRGRMCLGCVSLPNIGTILGAILGGPGPYNGPPGIAFWLPDSSAASDLCHFFFIKPNIDIDASLTYDAKAVPLGVVEMGGLLYCVLMLVHNDPLAFEAAIKSRFPNVNNVIVEAMDYQWPVKFGEKHAAEK
jgi:hypothetical protein